MEDDKKKFVNWLKKVIKIDGLITGKKLSQKVGVDPSTISGYLTGRTKGPELPLRLRICEEMGVDYEEILEAGRQVTQLGAEDVKQIVAGEMNKYSRSVPTTNLEEYKTQKNHLHHDKIDEFKEQDRALRINSILVEIEKSDFDVLDKIEKMVQLEFDVLKKKELINSLLWNRF